MRPKKTFELLSDKSIIFDNENGNSLENIVVIIDILEINNDYKNHILTIYIYKR